MVVSKGPILRFFYRPLGAVVLLGLLILVTVGVKARVWRDSAAASANKQELLTTTRGAAQIVRFTVYDAGIFPRDARAGAGLVELHFEDMSPGSAGLVVVGESLQTVTQIVRQPLRWRGNVRVRLLPGRYEVYDASRPAHRARLIIER